MDLQMNLEKGSRRTESGSSAAEQVNVDDKEHQDSGPLLRTKSVQKLTLLQIGSQERCVMLGVSFWQEGQWNPISSGFFEATSISRQGEAGPARKLLRF